MTLARRIAAIAATAGALLAGACAAPQKPAANASDSSATKGGLGLEVARWYLDADPRTRASGIASAVESGLAARVECDLGRNGFTVLSVPSERLGELLSALGGSPTVRRTTLGQVTAWADLSTARFSRERTVVVAGKVGPVAPRDDDRAGGPDLEALVKLSLRGWCFPTVEGASARLELRASEEPGRPPRMLLDPARSRDRVRELRMGKVVIECPAGQALVVLETPIVPPEPSEDEGPPAVPPPTVAAILLDGAPFPDRALALAIVPSFADILPPAPPLRVAGRADETPPALADPAEP